MREREAEGAERTKHPLEKAGEREAEAADEEHGAAARSRKESARARVPSLREMSTHTSAGAAPVVVPTHPCEEETVSSALVSRANMEGTHHQIARERSQAEEERGDAERRRVGKALRVRQGQLGEEGRAQRRRRRDGRRTLARSPLALAPPG